MAFLTEINIFFINLSKMLEPWGAEIAPHGCNWGKVLKY